MRQSRFIAFGAGALLLAAGCAAHAASAYPPSCFSEGLPLGQASTDPRATSAALSLHGDFNACFVNPAASSYATAQQECAYAETVTITVWRVPCSGGTSATLMEIDRPSGMRGNTNLYPTFPGVWVQQGFSAATFIRLAPDANTANATAFVNSPVYDNSVYVLETDSTGFNYNRAFTMAINNNTGRSLVFDLGDYNPADFPNAQPLPISGYLSGSWYDPTHGGEGILTQVLDNAGGTTRTLFAAWYTFDALGMPTWIVAQAAFPIGATQVSDAPVLFLSGGGFAGDFSATTSAPWGTMSFSFPDCNSLHFTYASASDPPSGAPVGSGTRDWQRIAAMSNLNCQ